METLFFREKPARLLVYVKRDQKAYASTLAKRIDCTYAHTVKLLDRMQQMGLVNFDRSGRIKYITLTSTGNDLAEHFESLIFRKLNGRK
ncbi:TPA: winged helix DNA-binding protein [archaeon]|uniref:Winged helix DNA-binding protein n=1 Tax=Candidatus Naiadarchaeum limnaeum TaxID=2756139 RepID=A0A832XLL1_9ARCH|nr:winged helix DNA-binding protein [Candidatus Naiadarchaeales archaeon SRR2090153.bin1042]HIK00023.1 winged helix DNA-binding protein [Candidatus Naiadarchaeum limnaeum]